MSVKLKQLFLTVSVFAFVSIMIPQAANAEGVVPSNDKGTEVVKELLTSEKELPKSEIQINAEKLEKLEDEVALKKEILDKKLAELERIQQEVVQVASTKEAVAVKVEQVKAEVQVKEVKVEEKKAAQIGVTQIASVIAGQTGGSGAANDTTDTTPPCNEATQWVRADNGQCLNKPNVTAPAPSYEAPTASPAPVRIASSGGNSYDGGQCTWHVKNLRPDLPNNLGNANEWYWNAQALGLSTGTTAQVGAAAPRKTGNHVVYVQAVYGDGTMLVSEMNYDYTPYNQRTAIKNQADFYYIY